MARRPVTHPFRLDVRMTESEARILVAKAFPGSLFGEAAEHPLFLAYRVDPPPLPKPQWWWPSRRKEEFLSDRPIYGRIRTYCAIERETTDIIEFVPREIEGARSPSLRRNRALLPAPDRRAGPGEVVAAYGILTSNIPGSQAEFDEIVAHAAEIISERDAARRYTDSHPTVIVEDDLSR